MGRVRKVTGEDVMSEDEFAAWWSEHHLQGEAFVDVLRRHLAVQLPLKNFRQLALVCGDEMLLPESHWMDAELVVVIRPLLNKVLGKWRCCRSDESAGEAFGPRH